MTIVKWAGCLSSPSTLTRITANQLPGRVILVGTRTRQVALGGVGVEVAVGATVPVGEIVTEGVIVGVSPGEGGVPVRVGRGAGGVSVGVAPGRVGTGLGVRVAVEEGVGVAVVVNVTNGVGVAVGVGGLTGSNTISASVLEGKSKSKRADRLGTVRL